MSGVVINEVRRDFYLDSVALMRLSRAIAERAGVEEAALRMGTPTNNRIMADAGLLAAAGQAAGGGDLVIGVRADSRARADEVLQEALGELNKPVGHGGAAAQWRPRTTRAALVQAPDSNLALISVPGDFAAAEARKALRRGLHVMMFSDNVSLAAEVALKHEARALGRLVMGPDCGTAIINGVPLAFANAVPRGSIGLIGASGTGLQEVSCLIARGGGGISHAIGVGGRDLDEQVGGVTTLMALASLDADPGTKHIVLISKPPAAEVAARIFERIGASGKSFTICFIGASDTQLPANARLADTLKAAAEDALGGGALGADFDPSPQAGGLPSDRDSVRGLFSGGTLCAEAQVIFRAAGQAVGSNAPIPGALPLEQVTTGHRLIDYGADEFTRGRPHPMIDPTVRDDALVEALTASRVGVILLDVVIGFGANPDPAGHLVDVLSAHRRADSARVVASVTGTDADPQDRSAQAAKLEAAGVTVAPSNADAAILALACLGSYPDHDPVIRSA